MSRKARKQKKLLKKAAKQKTKRPLRKWVPKTKKSKSWMYIKSPKVFNEQIVGQTIALNPEDAIGRKTTIKLGTVMSGTGPSSQSMVTLKIIGNKGNDLSTEIVKYQLSRMNLLRLVRRRASKIDSVDDLFTKDNIPIRIKSLAITLKKATSTQRTSVKNKLTELIGKEVNKYTYEALLLSVITSKLQHEVQNKVKKIYPLRKFEVRSVEIRTIKKKLGSLGETAKMEEAKENLENQTTEVETTEVQEKEVVQTEDNPSTEEQTEDQEEVETTEVAKSDDDAEINEQAAQEDEKMQDQIESDVTDDLQDDKQENLDKDESRYHYEDQGAIEEQNEEVVDNSA